MPIHIRALRSVAGDMARDGKPRLLPKWWRLALPIYGRLKSEAESLETTGFPRPGKRLQIDLPLIFHLGRIAA